MHKTTAPTLTLTLILALILILALALALTLALTLTLTLTPTPPHQLRRTAVSPNPVYPSPIPTVPLMQADSLTFYAFSRAAAASDDGHDRNAAGPSGRPGRRTLQPAVFLEALDLADEMAGF